MSSLLAMKQMGKPSPGQLATLLVLLAGLTCGQVIAQFLASGQGHIVGSHDLAVTTPSQIAQASELLPGRLLVFEQKVEIKAHNADSYLLTPLARGPIAGNICHWRPNGCKSLVRAISSLS